MNIRLAELICGYKRINSVKRYNTIFLRTLRRISIEMTLLHLSKALSTG